MTEALPTDSPAGRPFHQRLRALRGVAFSSQLRVNLSSGIGTTFVNVLVMSASYPLYLHFLGYDRLGVWLLLATVQMFAQFGLLGIGPALTKLVAEEHGNQDTDGAQRYISMSTALLFGTGTLTILVVTFFRNGIISALHLTGTDATTAFRLLPWIGVLTLYTFLMQVVSGSLAGFGRLDIYNYCLTASKILVLVAEVVLLKCGVGIVSLLIGDFLGCAVVHGTGAIALHRIGNVRLLRVGPSTFDPSRFAKLIRFGGGVFTASLTGLFISPMNKVFLSRFAGPAIVPLYDIAFNGSTQLRGLADAGLRALMPEVSRINATLRSGGTTNQSLGRLYLRAFRLVAALCVPMYLLLVFAAPILLRVWLHRQFDPRIVPIFQLMTLSAFISLVAVPAYYTLMGAGYIRRCMICHLIAAATNAAIVVAAAFLTKTVTLHLVGWAVVTSTIISSLYLLLSVRSVIGQTVVNVAGLEQRGTIAPALATAESGT